MGRGWAGLGEEQRAVSRSRVRSRDVDDLQFEEREEKRSVSQTLTK